MTDINKQTIDLYLGVEPVAEPFEAPKWEHPQAARCYSPAITLNPSDLGAHPEPDGWTIEGEIREDYFEWVEDFEAQHPVYGKVWGDFEEAVWADSKEGYEHFIQYHAPECWDYGDI